MIINETEGRAVQQYGRGILCVGGKNSVVQNRDLNILVPYDVLNAEGYELKKKNTTLKEYSILLCHSSWKFHVLHC